MFPHSCVKKIEMILTLLSGKQQIQELSKTLIPST